MILSFPEEFYRAEEMEGFYVNETMKRYWACLLDMVCVVDRVCEKYNLTYYADWGTLLGAVRHGGFVPWDDDIDLALKRPEYEKLMEVLPQELPEGWTLSNVFSNEAHRQFFAGLSNGQVLDLSKEHLKEYHGCPFVATLDICPLDYLPRDEREADVVRTLFTVIWTVVSLIQNEASQDEIEKAVQEVELLCDVSVDRSKTLRSEMWKLANQLVMSYQENEGDYLVQWCYNVNRRGDFKLDKCWYDEIIRMPFENITIPVPKQYDEILSVLFGDWRTPDRSAIGHDYPHFKKQLDFLKRTVNEMKEGGNSL